VEVVLLDPERSRSLEPREDGFFCADVDDAPPGTAYAFRLDRGAPRPDPASRWQRDTVHGPSVVFDAAPLAAGRPRWAGRPLEELVLYEIHVGTFTPEGTLEAAEERLPALAALGVTAVELMPLAQFPGARNWGYDGVQPFAVQNAYGGPASLFAFVDACHREGLSVFLDVVYNHLGPEGNYLAEFGPYFSSRHRTPWGEAINFDGPDSDGVRRYFLENAMWWMEEVGCDGLRLDAVHAIVDTSARPFLAELAEAADALAERLGRPCILVAESDRNDPRVVRRRGEGGLGLHAQWNDDFHHALHVALTGETQGYYADFVGVPDLVKVCNEGFVLDGRRSVYRRRRHGAPAKDVPRTRFVVCAQNHDQVGNRKDGERLASLVPFEDLKLAAGAVLLSPFVPLLFMGEEYGETAPFQYFVSHGDPALVEAVRSGRADEFASFAWSGPVPDPQSESTFLRSKLSAESERSRFQEALRGWYRHLLALRGRQAPGAFRALPLPGGAGLLLCRDHPGRRSRAALHFAREAGRMELEPGTWTKAADSSDPRWAGPGSGSPARVESGRSAREIPLAPRSCVLWMEEISP
jgi:maltooligosyltrehalose trehalohydrolase